MMVIFSFILALALLVGIIYALRQHQERTRQELVAREQPLPPLPKKTATDTTAKTVGLEERPVPPAPEAPAPAQPPTAETSDWRQACQELRDQGRFDEALSVCQQAWPQWQSFDHAARVMRAAIRTHARDSVQYQSWLQRLYTLAAQASFLHDKVDGLPDPNRQQLTRLFTPQQVATLDMPWSQIGYQHLRLLTKSDRKQLVQWLGEPETHQSARIFHDKQWLTSIS